MALPDARVPIESDGHILRARRTAAFTRIAVGLAGLALLLAHPHLLPHPLLGLCGFLIIALTALVQIAAPRLSWLSVEESLAGTAGLLIIGLGDQRVGVLALLWLAAVASGVLARGGRVHWIGRNIVLCSLLLPVLREGSLSAEYGGLLAATLGLLLTSGRLTRELNLLLRQARLEAESAETLLLAGDIASRMSDRGERLADQARGLDQQSTVVLPGSLARTSERRELARVIAGEGLSMAVQPIVDIRSGSVHAYEALARFQRRLGNGSPLDWFELAEQLGERPALERACLAQALELFRRRPAGSSLSVNLSAPVLLEEATTAMLSDVASYDPGGDLEGLIVEITEETLVHSDRELAGAIDPLRALGAQLAVDDMGAGYSGLRQITSVRPRYLKLDRSLITDIHQDSERAALVGALVGYSNQVGCLLVAEGVETEAELQAVRRLGVPLVQGFYLSRPGPPWPKVCADATTSVPSGPAGELLAAELAAREILQPA
jgi:EAL domain-containing protein (putative c-di-GMP-specific phosphodiesterase class I)